MELGDLEDQTTSSNLDTSFISNQSDDLFDDETPCDQQEEQDDVIDQTRGRVFHQDIQTPRSVLKNEAVGRVF